MCIRVYNHQCLGREHSLEDQRHFHEEGVELGRRSEWRDVSVNEILDSSMSGYCFALSEKYQKLHVHKACTHTVHYMKTLRYANDFKNIKGNAHKHSHSPVQSSSYIFPQAMFSDGPDDAPYGPLGCEG